MRYLGLLLLSVLSFSVFAANNNPIVTATKFYESLISNNIAVARTLIANPDNLPNDGSTKFDIDKYYFFKTNTIKNVANIKTSTVNKDGTLSFDTVLESKNGVWKVNFEKTMLNMMRGAVKKGQVSGQVDLSIDKK